MKDKLGAPIPVQRKEDCLNPLKIIWRHASEAQEHGKTEVVLRYWRTLLKVDGPLQGVEIVRREPPEELVEHVCLKFGRSVSDYRYHVQEAVYRHVYKLITGDDLQAFYFLAVEEESPHSNEMLLLDDEALEIGEFYFRKNLREYAECLNSGKWPHKPINELISLPYYAFNQYEMDSEINELEGFIV